MVDTYMRLFRGRQDAYGTGEGRWIKKPPRRYVYENHLQGIGPGLGIAPLLDNGKVWFAAIDLDEPDFDAARELQKFLKFGHTFIERSRSGNAHIWAFFEEPIDAWIPRGIMREAIAGIGKPTVECFPKQNRLLAGMFGNYINLPYHGEARPILIPTLDGGTLPRPSGLPTPLGEVTLEMFVRAAMKELNSPIEWRKRADWLMIAPPEEREHEAAEFGTASDLHICGQEIIARRDEVPVSEGHRNVVYFCLAKMLANWEACDREEALYMMKLVRDSADQQGVSHVTDSELKRILSNAERGKFVSTGCDDPLMAPFISASCPIGNPK
jgi:hypothetical protein